MQDTLGQVNASTILAAGIEPVSYTHLDVYKRQAQDLVKGLALGSDHDDGAVGFFPDFATNLPAI